MKALKVAGWSMIGMGSLILLFLVYQLAFTNLLTARAQSAASDALEVRFAELRAEPAEAVEVIPDLPELPGEGVDNPEQGEAPENQVTPRAEPISFFPEDAPELGTEIGRIVIPKIELDLVVVEGVDRDNLRRGPGHMPWTPMPGQVGNTVISGHRVTNGAPFFSLDELEPGDEILVETVTGTHTYVVREQFSVLPTDVWVTNSRPGAWLTLTTCNPRFSARERLITVAELVDGPNLEYAQAVKNGIIEEASA